MRICFILWLCKITVFIFFDKTASALSIYFQEECLVTFLLPQRSSWWHGEQIKWSSHKEHTTMIFANFSSFDLRLIDLPNQNTSQFRIMVHQSYWRFNWKYYKKCVSVILFPSDREEQSQFDFIMLTFSRVGFGNREDSTFYIVNPAFNFTQELALFIDNDDADPEIPDIFGTLVLLNVDEAKDITSYSIYCHLCPDNQKFTWITLKRHEMSENSAIRSLGIQLNSNGYGEGMYIQTSPFNQSSPTKCDKSELFYSKNADFLLKCNEFLFHKLVTENLNLTLLHHKRRSPKATSMPVLALKWGLSDQGTVKIVFFLTLKYFIMHCEVETKVTVLGWDVYFRPFDIPTWTGVAAISGASLILFRRSLFKSISLFQIFLSQPVPIGRKEPKLFLFHALVTLTLLMNVYLCGMSTDFLTMAPFSELEDLLEKGYQVEIGSQEELKYALSVNFLKGGNSSMYLKYKSSFMANKNGGTFADRNKLGDLMIRMFQKNILLGLNDFGGDLIPIFASSLSKFDDKYCTKYDFELIPIMIGISTWSYMSETISKEWYKWVEHGLINKWMELKKWAYVLAIEDKNKIVSSWWIKLVPDPKNLGLSSLLKLVCLTQVVALLIVSGVEISYWTIINLHSLNFESLFSKITKIRETSVEIFEYEDS